VASRAEPVADGDPAKIPPVQGSLADLRGINHDLAVTDGSATAAAATRESGETPY